MQQGFYFCLHSNTSIDNKEVLIVKPHSTMHHIMREHLFGWLLNPKVILFMDIVLSLCSAREVDHKYIQDLTKKYNFNN